MSIDENKLQNYIIILIIGYFGVKIFYGLFNKYSKKPMRNEIVDFSVMIVMGSLLFILTNMNNRNIFNINNNINWIFFIGYILGLNVAFVYQEFSNNEDVYSNKYIQYLFFAIFIFILLIMLFLSIKSSFNGYGNPLSYILYLIVIAIIIMGLIMTRKKTSLYEATKFNKDLQDIFDQLSVYFNTEILIKMIDDDTFRETVQMTIKTGDTDKLVKIVTDYFPNFPQMQNKQHIIDLLLSLDKPILQKGYINDNGSNIYFGLAMIGWILSLLFMYDSDENILQKLLSGFNGLTIGIFVSGVSFYGFPYILNDTKGEQCFGDDECSRKNMILKNKEYIDVTSSLSTIKWGLTFTIIILIVIIILFYLTRF